MQSTPNAGSSTMCMRILNGYKEDSYYVSIPDGKETVGFEHTFSGDKFHVKTMGYSIRVNVKDRDNNWIEWHKDFDGIFSGALHFLEDIWNGIVGAIQAAAKAVEDAVNYIVKWVTELLKKAFEAVINAITSVFNGIATQIANVIRGMLSGGGGRSIELRATELVVSIMGMMQIVNTESSLAEVFAGVDSAAVAAEGTATAASGGILAVIKKGIVPFMEKIIENKLFSLIAATISMADARLKFDSVIEGLMTGKSNRIFEAIGSILGIGESTIETMKKTYDALKHCTQSKRFWFYYLGFALAITGFLTSLIVAQTGAIGQGKINADIIMVVVAVGGAIMFFIGKNSKEQQFRTAIADITTLVEEIAVIVGAIASLVKLGWDWAHQGGG